MLGPVLLSLLILVVSAQETRYASILFLSFNSLFSDSADFGGTTLMNLLSSLFIGQLVQVIANGDPTLTDVSFDLHPCPVSNQ